MNTANKITIARIGLIPLFMMAMQPYPQWMSEHFAALRFLNEYGVYIGTAIFLLASATDKLDGYIARKRGQVTNLGKLLDPLADKLLVSTALIMLVYTHQVGAWAAAIMIGREIVITAIRMIASAQGIALAADRYGKWKMVLQVAAIVAVLLDNYPFAVVTGFPVDDLLVVAAAVLTIYSGTNYIRSNYRLLRFGL